MASFNNTPDSTNLAKGLEMVELEERLEMVHLAAIDADGSYKCDAGGGKEIAAV